MHKAGGYDNHHPRDQQAQFKGFGARALAAHQNGFESLIVFAAAILLAIATDTTNETVQLVAMTHIGFRVTYHIFYLLNKDILRSLSWAIAIGCSFVIVIKNVTSCTKKMQSSRYLNSDYVRLNLVC